MNYSDVLTHNDLLPQAQEQAGGRACTVPLENSHIELGAQWIHGEDNPIHHFAHKHNLLSNVTSAEGLGLFSFYSFFPLIFTFHS